MAVNYARERKIPYLGKYVQWNSSNPLTPQTEDTSAFSIAMLCTSETEVYTTSVSVACYDEMLSLISLVKIKKSSFLSLSKQFNN